MIPSNSTQGLQNIVFMGTPEIAVDTLKELINSDYKVVLIVSQPDKPRGRNQKVEETPVKIIALQYDIPCFQPIDINTEESIAYIASYKPDLIFTFAYGAFLCRKLRNLPKYGAVNLHPSILPLHRGADPIRSSLLAGDTVCGITVFFLSNKMDAGRIVSRETFPLAASFNYSLLEEYLSVKAKEVAIASLKLIATRPKEYFPEQDNEMATYSQKLTPGSNAIDFDVDSYVFLNRMKAYTDEPGYYCTFREKRLKIYKAIKYSKDYPSINSRHDINDVPASAPITDLIANRGFVISLKDEDILIQEVQLEGKKRMSAWQFHLGAKLQKGERLYNGV